MNDEIRKLLDDEIKKQIQDLSNLESGSEKKATAIDDITKLCKLTIEDTKATMDFDEKRERRVMEKEQMANESETHKSEERNKLDEQVKERYVKIGIAAAEIVLPLIFYGVWMKKGLKFEETGNFTSTTFRGLINRFRPTK